MIYKFITNNPDLAKYAVQCGVNRVFVDMEYIGKHERQGNLDTHKARHTFKDVLEIKKVIGSSADLLVRINPIHSGTKNEIDGVIEAGADIIMLPMFKTEAEVLKCIELIDSRTNLCLLLETPQALVRLDDILQYHSNIQEIHFGLNDMHLGLGLDFMFEVLTGGLVEFTAKRIQNKAIRFGFGGIAKVGEGVVPAEYVLGEHVRLNSEMVILSRTFHQNSQSAEELETKVNLKEELIKLNTCIQDFKQSSSDIFLQNKMKLHNAVKIVADRIRKNKENSK
jgi:hypothetical protein